MEKVIKAHLRTSSEYIDDLVKKHARLCLNDVNITTTQELFSKLLTVSVDLCKSVAILQKWIVFVSNELKQVNPNCSDEVLSNKIWTRFIIRLSLCPWLIVKPKDSKAENGLEVLGLFMDVCQDVVYGLFAIIVELKEIPQEIIKPRLEPIRVVEPNKFESKQFQTIFNGFGPSRLTLPSITEENKIVTEEPKLAKGILYTPDIQQNGTKITIRKRSNQEVIPRKKREPKKKQERKKKKQVESDSDSYSSSDSDS